MLNLTKPRAGFGIPCTIDPVTKSEKQFVGLLKIIRFEVYYVRGAEPTKPPDYVEVSILSNETLELYYTGGYRPEEEPIPVGVGEYERMIYTSPLVLKPISTPLLRGYRFIVGRDAWTWTKVDEMNIGGVMWYIWDGMAKADKVPMAEVYHKVWCTHRSHRPDGSRSLLKIHRRRHTLRR
jgi:hypothetical protein